MVAGVPNFNNLKFNQADFRFDQSLSRLLNKTHDIINGALSYTFGKGVINQVDETCGNNRTLTVTISNLNT